MAKRILSRHVAFSQDPPEKLCITRSDLDDLFEVRYALGSAIELAGKADNPVKDIVVVCAREMGRILSEIDRRSQGGRQ